MPDNTQTIGINTSRDLAFDKAKIMLVGNPNCGKTTVFNGLTGSNYKVANYPGVTVEKKSGNLNLGKDQSGDNIFAEIVDLPGIYTLSGESIDELIASECLIEEKPDLLIAVVDASNLERNLFVVSEVLDLGIPLILALNMNDLAEQRGIVIRSSLLEKELDVPVVKLSSLENKNLSQLKQVSLKVLNQPKVSSKAYIWKKDRPEGNVLPIKENPASAGDYNASDYAEIASLRYKWINSVIKKSVSFEPRDFKKLREKIDDIATHQVMGLFIFFSIMALIFQSIFTWASLPMDFIDGLIETSSQFLNNRLPSGQLKSLLIDGILAGVGSVLIFVPQIAILFFFIGLLEDSGYLTRAAFVMDKVMRKFGLQGRSFIPLLSSFACAIPGIMSTRSIPSLGDRFVTILVAPLMSCSARLPVFTLLIAAFIPQIYLAGFVSLQGLVMFSLYALGVIAAGLVAWVCKHTLFRGEPAIFVMEMPPLKFPSLTLVLRNVWDRVWIFIKDAGTIIFACSIVLWFLATHPVVSSEEGSAPPAVEDSYAGQLGKSIEPIIKPLGFDWKIGVGLLASFAAREVFVSSLATVHNLESESEASVPLTKLLKEGKKSGSGLELPGALSLLVFYVFACQCMSTLAVCKRETGSWKWPALMFLYMTALAYFGALFTYQLSKAIF